MSQDEKSVSFVLMRNQQKVRIEADNYAEMLETLVQRFPHAAATDFRLAWGSRWVNLGVWLAG